MHRGGARSRVAVIILLFHFFLVARKVAIENRGHCLDLLGIFRPTPLP